MVMEAYMYQFKYKYMPDFLILVIDIFLNIILICLKSKSFFKISYKSTDCHLVITLRKITHIDSGKKIVPLYLLNTCICYH